MGGAVAGVVGPQGSDSAFAGYGGFSESSPGEHDSLSNTHISFTMCRLALFHAPAKYCAVLCLLARRGVTPYHEKGIGKIQSPIQNSPC